MGSLESYILSAVGVSASLANKIRHVLKHSDPNSMYRFRNSNELESAHHFREIASPHVSGVIEARDHVVHANEQVEYLKRLYATASPDDQSSFCSELLIQLNTANAFIVASTLLDLRDTLSLLYWEQFDEAALWFWRGLANKLALEHWDLTDTDLERIERGLHRLEHKLRWATEEHEAAHPGTGYSSLLALAESVLADVRHVLDRVRYLRVRDEVHGIANPAIDVDRRLLLSRVERLGFDPALATLFEEVERRGQSASTDVEFKSAMDLLRSAFEGFARQALAKLAAARQTPDSRSEGPLPFVRCKDYLHNSGLITSKESELLQKLYNYLSTEGAHSLGTGIEQFNVSRVTVIEWCMMIAGRVERSSKAGT